MEHPFKVGQEVVCVNDDPHSLNPRFRSMRYPGKFPLRKGRVYVVSDAFFEEGRPGVRLKGAALHRNCTGLSARRFRPVDRLQEFSGMEVLRGLLREGVLVG